LANTAAVQPNVNHCHHEHRYNQWPFTIAEILQSSFALLDSVETW